MRFGHVLVSRPVYYDRTPINRSIGYSAAAIGPHGTTVRASYTVPAAKKVFVENCMFSVLRDAVGAGITVQKAFVNYTPNGGSAIGIGLVINGSNTLYSWVGQSTGPYALMQAGDLIELRTQDDTTGGTGNYALAAKMTEYDV